MNRKQRRQAEKKGVTEKFDPESTFQVKFDFKFPGGLLRDVNPSQRAGMLEAVSEIDITRGVLVRLMETFGFIQHEQAVIGLLASVINPFPKRIRGALAYAIIQGSGMMIDMNEVEVCVFCEAEKQMTLDPEQPVPEDECAYIAEEIGDEAGYCGAPANDPWHVENSINWLHNFEEPDPLMKDGTVHAENCDARPLAEGEDRNVAEPQWKEVEAVVVLTPVMYEPLEKNEEETEEEGAEEGEVVEAGLAEEDAR